MKLLTLLVAVGIVFGATAIDVPAYAAEKKKEKSQAKRDRYPPGCVPGGQMSANQRNKTGTPVCIR